MKQKMKARVLLLGNDAIELYNERGKTVRSEEELVPFHNAVKFFLKAKNKIGFVPVVCKGCITTLALIELEEVGVNGKAIPMVKIIEDYDIELDLSDFKHDDGSDLSSDDVKVDYEWFGDTVE